MTSSFGFEPSQDTGMTPPGWLATRVPLTLLMDLACIEEPTYPAELGAAFARETTGSSA